MMESLYEDRATILRIGQRKKPSGETVPTDQPETIYSDVPCRLSQTGLPKDGQTEAQNDIRYEAKLFISPDIEIKQGDLVNVTKAGVVRSFVAAEPFPYSSHLEVSLLREGYA
jgi:hypothetical protein